MQSRLYVSRLPQEQTVRWTSQQLSLMTKKELKLYPKRLHEVLGGDITADPLPLSNEDYLGMHEKFCC